MNNVMVAAEYGRRVHGFETVLIVDFDIHFGNGRCLIRHGAVEAVAGCTYICMPLGCLLAGTFDIARQVNLVEKAVKIVYMSVHAQGQYPINGTPSLNSDHFHF